MYKLLSKIICMIIFVLAINAFANDYIQYPTVIRVFYNDDVLGRCDKIITALSIHLMNNGKWRILPDKGKLIVVDGWTDEIPE